MVSLRRRKLLGYSTGIASSEIELPRSMDIGSESQNPIQDGKSVSVHPTPSSDLQPPKEGSDSKVTGSSNVSGTSSSKEEQDQYIAGPEIKRRKRHRRKQLPDHEPCTMRGVYYKNSKWQAAIKVDKKQIHLGTVATQKEAAHLYDRYFRLSQSPTLVPNYDEPELYIYEQKEPLEELVNSEMRFILIEPHKEMKNSKTWEFVLDPSLYSKLADIRMLVNINTWTSYSSDTREYTHQMLQSYDLCRAAFMCGREPNFGLPEEEQQELRKVNWEEFLARTRCAIMTRKYQRRMIAGLKQQERLWQTGDDTEQSQGGVTASEDAEPKVSDSS